MNAFSSASSSVGSHSIFEASSIVKVLRKMAEFPEVWNEILKRMGLTSFDGIENIRKILTFMGYTTLQSISKLNKPKELCCFRIEFSNLKTNIEFCEKYPELKKWQLGHGTVGVLMDIAKAAGFASFCDEADYTISVQKTVFERCRIVRVSFLF